MGFFWKTRSDEIIEDIQEIVGNINRDLLQAEHSLVHNRGCNADNIEELGTICSNLQQKQTYLESLMSQISSTKLSNVNVPWVDGRYFPIVLWMGSYNMSIARIKKWMTDYARNF